MPAITVKNLLSHKARFSLLLLSTLGLGACGENWDAVAYSGFPYNNIRTAGHGIAYVRDNMLPGNGLVLKAEEPSNADIVIRKPPKITVDKEETTSKSSEKTLNALDKAFNKEMRK